MNKLPLNLKHFVKIKEDKNTTTLKHKEGHEIKVTHKALSPDIQKHLKSLPLFDSDTIEKFADGGEVQKMADGGGPVSSSAAPVSGDFSDVQSYQPNSSSMPGPSPMPAPTPSPDDAMYPPPSKPVYSEPAPQSPSSVAPPANLYQEPKSSSSDQPQVSSKSQQSSDPYGMRGANDLYTTALQHQMGGMQGQANAAANLGQAQASAIESNQKLMKGVQEDYQNQLNDNLKEYNDLKQDVVDGHIDPKAYLGNMSTGKRIATTIGLIMSGIGSGLTGQPNLAYKMLDDNINRDIEAQKANLGKKESLLSANMKHFGNITDAMQATRAQMNGMISNEMQAAAAKAQGPQAKAAAQVAIGGLEKEAADHYQQISMRQTMMKLANGEVGGSQSGEDNTPQRIAMLRSLNQEKIADDLQSKYVPGVGLAKVPVSEGNRSNLLAKQDLDNRAKDLYNWSAQHSGSLSPTDIATGKTKSAELQSMYRNAINGGVFKKGEQEFIDNIVDSDPAKFFNDIRVLPKLKEVISSNEAQLNSLKKIHGLPIAQQSQQQPSQQQSQINFRPVKR